jgi:hypothetical protein
MSAFLELARDVALLSGAASAPPSVAGQSGRLAKVVAWTVKAWEMIQLANPNWNFLRAEWSGALVPGETGYGPADLGIAERFGEFIGDSGSYRPLTLYDPDIGAGDEGPLDQISWELWRSRYGRGAQSPSRPAHYAIAPDRGLRFGPAPDRSWSVRGEYRKAPQLLAADEDVPDLPARYHQIIVWKAILLMSEHDEAVQGVALAEREYAPLLNQLQRDHLPAISARGGEPPIA